MDQDRRDLLGDGPDDLDVRDDDRYGEPPDGSASGSVLRGVLAPEALALASLVLAGVSLIGFSLLNGSPYLAVISGEGGAPDQSAFVLSALLGTGLALLPALLGLAALRRLPEGSPSRATAGAGVVVAAVSVVLRLVITVQTVTADNVQFVQF